MADSKKCDRCGALYEKTETNIFDTFSKTIIDMTDSIFHPETFKLNKILDNIEAVTDLCPDCSNLLEEWFLQGGANNG